MPEPRRYDAPGGDPKLGFESTRDLEAISAHIERYWGQVDSVFHEIVSEYVHVDIHWIAPTAERQYHTLITSGMSDRPMTVPEGAEEWGYSELVLALPPEWPMDQESFHDEQHYWPFRQIKMAARFPHVFRTWLWHSHTLANGEDLSPFSADAEYGGLILGHPLLCDEEAWMLKISPEKQIYFHSVIPIYPEELRFAWTRGSDALFDRLDAIGVNELVAKSRPNVALE